MPGKSHFPLYWNIDTEQWTELPHDWRSNWMPSFQCPWDFLLLGNGNPKYQVSVNRRDLCAIM